MLLLLLMQVMYEIPSVYRRDVFIVKQKAANEVRERERKWVTWSLGIICEVSCGDFNSLIRFV